MKVFTIGYGGRSRENFLSLVTEQKIQAIVDVRLRPDRASMGLWVKAKTPDKGIESWLNAAGIAYHSLPELGNIFLGRDDWHDDYRELLVKAGELLVPRLAAIPEPYCLMCAEKRVAECHRRDIADYLARTRHVEIQHLE